MSWTRACARGWTSWRGIVTLRQRWKPWRGDRMTIFEAQEGDVLERTGVNGQVHQIVLGPVEDYDTEAPLLSDAPCKHVDYSRTAGGRVYAVMNDRVCRGSETAEAADWKLLHREEWDA